MTNSFDETLSKAERDAPTFLEQNAKWLIKSGLPGKYIALNGD